MYEFTVSNRFHLMKVLLDRVLRKLIILKFSQNIRIVFFQLEVLAFQHI